MNKVRVRFAPSPTGGLHIGGLRTALFNYLFAKKNQGAFILRIEDTDQNRLVEGAEEYIIKALEWCGINPNEGGDQGGEYGPYKQSERKNSYRKYAEKLITDGKAYYAFDTSEELEEMRNRLKKNRVLNPQYDTVTRMTMKNSLTISTEEVNQKLANGVPYVIRIKIPEKEEVRFNDMIRGWVMVHTEFLDDKVLLKSDGMPTYHLANIVDDYLMKITHVIRGEEWLPSAPLHILLYHYLGWEESIPKFAHLPLILKPDGNGKLSKRAAEKAGFPIFPLSWKDKESEKTSIGFKEMGFMPTALINFLAFLGWNPGTDQELFSLEELVEEFSENRINKAGTKFDFNKAKWFNQQYIKATASDYFVDDLQKAFKKYDIACSSQKAVKIIDLFKERVTLPHEFIEKGLIFFQEPEKFDEKIIKKKWNSEGSQALLLFAEALENDKIKSAEETKDLFCKTLEAAGYKPNQYMQLLRLTLTGESSGPDLMDLILILGMEKAAKRIKTSIDVLNLTLKER